MRLIHDPATDIYRHVTPQRKRQPGFLYAVIHPSWPEFVKLGLTRDVQQRLASFQTNCPRHDYRIAHSVATTDMWTAEKRLHTPCSRTGERREWFRVTLVEAISALEATASA